MLFDVEKSEYDLKSARGHYSHRLSPDRIVNYENAKKASDKLLFERYLPKYHKKDYYSNNNAMGISSIDPCEIQISNLVF